MKAIESKPQSEQFQALSKIRKEANTFKHKVSSARRANQSWDFSLTIAGITLTLAITLLGAITLEREVSEAQKRKYIIGLGACGVAVQSFLAAYPMRQKLNGYRSVEAQASNLLTTIDSIPKSLTDKELESTIGNVRDRLCYLRTEQSKVETNFSFDELTLPEFTSADNKALHLDEIT